MFLRLVEQKQDKLDLCTILCMKLFLANGKTEINLIFRLRFNLNHHA